MTLSGLCPDAFGHVASFLSPSEQSFGDGVCFESGLSPVRTAVRPLHTLAQVCRTLYAFVHTTSPMMECLCAAQHAFVRVQSHDAALSLDPREMRRVGRKVERVALLERMLFSIGACGGLPVRLSASSAVDSECGDLQFGRGYIAEIHRIPDTEVECGDCSMVEANWVHITVRCAKTGQKMRIPRRFECGTLRIESLNSRDHGRISVLMESFEQEEIMFSMLLFRSKKECAAWGFDWNKWGGDLGSRLGVTLGPASKRSARDFNELMMGQRSPVFELSSSP